MNNSFFDAGAAVQLTTQPAEAAEAPSPAQSRVHLSRLIEVIGLHRAALLKYVRRILLSEQDAEDVVQETSIRLLRVQDLWRGEREVRALLFKIATNLARDELRRRKARCQTMHMSYESIDIVADAEQPDHTVDRVQAMEVISSTLSTLPARYQQVFSLHIDAEMSYRAIARQLGISTKTVERDMCGAQELCQDRLNNARRSVAA
ncbi:RNA polymerase sigma-70 factor (ECF subfamily) [Povalibacter uvarum]|uniref:RNA polymerase sigma-70 factor (ECF subfamily) n=1 Tax=Povalibacter uvarum TaxID=732238 RepID=A0A841HUH3_9GAMM|nr:sigma-70 family RNA polymerase sigma factor [Povalibacter uvarum]MBB6096463.1 RNA polymerase sigma-70 factor (ECF subfamily) [Povalibacter uvarum]